MAGNSPEKCLVVASSTLANRSLNELAVIWIKSQVQLPPAQSQQMGPPLSRHRPRHFATTSGTRPGRLRGTAFSSARNFKVDISLVTGRRPQRAARDGKAGWASFRPEASPAAACAVAARGRPRERRVAASRNRIGSAKAGGPRPNTQGLLRAQGLQKSWQA